MTKKSLQHAAIGVVTSLVLMLNSATAVVNAQGFISPNDSPQAIQQGTGSQGSLREIVKTIVQFFLTFLGLIAVVMIIYGGFLYVTSAGKEESIGTAKKIIMYAVIGIIVILISYAVVTTILGAATGTPG